MINAKIGRALTCLGLALLLLGILFPLWRRPVRELPVIPDLENAMSWTLPGWAVRDTPLGASEALDDETRRVLRMDAFVYKTFTRDNVSFSIYVAYWATCEDRLPVVMSHLPDHCWVSAGLHCVSYKNKALFEGAEKMPPAEWRSFSTPSGEKLEVAYWLWFGHEPFRFGNGLTDRADSRPGFNRANLFEHQAWWLDHLIKGNREQMFVRCTSNIPFDDLLKIEGVAPLLSKAAWLGSRKPLVF